MRLQTGAVTFLFTDIEGSTQLWERSPNAMSAALARHDALLRRVIEEHGGRVFKTVGDQFCAVFRSAPAATTAALEAQRALGAEGVRHGDAPVQLRVRMALHSGVSEERLGDYFGPPLNRLSRLLRAGHGGQILISGATAELLRDRLPPATSLLDLGEHALRDLPQPERIFQLVASDLAVEFPALRTAAAEMSGEAPIPGPSPEAGDVGDPSGWRIQLLGGFRAECGDRVVTRFDTQKAAALFAYLACHTHRAAYRDELVELLWPGGDPDAGRTSLRTALASLRRQLEPHGIEAGSVIAADRQSVRLNPLAVSTDVAAFERERQAAETAEEGAEQRALLEHAASLYGGELLPGQFDTWVLAERERLTEAFVAVLRRLAASLAAAGEPGPAIETARRAVQAGRLDEAAHYDLIRLYAATGQTVAAKQQYRELERLLREELDERPSLEFDRLLPARPPVAPPPHPPETPEPPPVPPLPSSALTGGGFVLPSPLTVFYGREPEIAQIRVLLAAPETRLLTLTGLGGTGKTRLAIEVARTARDAGEHEVCFVPLAELTDPARILEAIRVALCLPAAGSETLDQLEQALEERPLLLVLDNFEQLVEGGARQVRGLLERLPQLRLLVTSRLPLGLSAEREYPVPPLPVPVAPATPERLQRFAGVQLFVERARAVRPGFEVTAGNAEAVAQLCHALDGIPLALELAAARASVLTAGQMLQHLTRRFEFLVGRHRDVAERHRTLRATLEWSVQSLSEAHQRLLARLSVFRGGWTLSTAEAVCAEPATLDLLMDLRDASLLIAEEAADEMRFRLLETVRAYASEALEALGESESVRRRHRDHYLQLALDARSGLHGAEQASWIDRLESEHGNLRAALAYCAESADSGEAALQFVVALDSFWDMRGHFQEGREECLRALAHSGAQTPTKVRASALNTAATFASIHGDPTAARAHLEEALTILREFDDESGIAWSLLNLGNVRRSEGSFREARRLIEGSLSRFRKIGVEGGVRSALSNLAYLAQVEGSLDEARTLHEESLAIKRSLGDRQSIAASLDNLGKLHRALGDGERARAFWEESLAIRREVGNKWGIASALIGLGLLARDRGDLDDALSLFEETLALLQELGDRPGIAAQQGNLSLAHCLHGDLGPARTLAERGLALRRELGEPNGIAEALAICAVVARAEGRTEEAVRLWREAQAHQIGDPAWASPADRALFERYGFTR